MRALGMHFLKFFIFISGYFSFFFLIRSLAVQMGTGRGFQDSVPGRGTLALAYLPESPIAT